MNEFLNRSPIQHKYFNIISAKQKLSAQCEMYFQVLRLFKYFETGRQLKKEKTLMKTRIEKQIRGNKSNIIN